MSQLSEAAVMQNETHSSDLSNAIAIIGLAGRFPQAKDLDEFWHNLRDGKEVVTFFEEDELLDAGIPPEIVKNPNYVPARACLDDAEGFDAAFFGYSPREAQVIDPQQRVFLECAWSALESAGYDPERYDGPVGVFGGTSMNSYLLANVLANPDVIQSSGGYQIMISNDKDFLTTRVSYKLNLKGPSVNVQSACSTSLVAVHLACQSLLSYQCDMALAGGVSVQTPRKGGYLYQPGMIMSPDGHCRAFDHRGQGIVAGEGVGMVVLKRYADAVADHDTIHAIIRGSAVNNDGSLKVGFTAPSVDGQTEAIMMAQAVGDVDPATITLIEAHGTGTELGDPVEISALTQAFQTSTQETGFCAISSVKTNMGHLDAAAGVAGLLKAVLSLKHKMLPPNLNFEKPNPRINFERSPFYVNTRLKAWDTERLPRRAGVSSFGIGGTNAHVVLEEAQPEPATPQWRAEQVLVFSARSETALAEMLNNFSAWMDRAKPENLVDAAYTLQVGRKVFARRAALVCSSVEDAVSALKDPDRKRLLTTSQEQRRSHVTFLFPGQGSQHVMMGRDLYLQEPLFRRIVDECAEILRAHLGFDLREILYPAPECRAEAERQLLQTAITQPALFTIEYALAKLWISWGIQPSAMIGHSIGEYVAACLAGVFTLEDGLALVAARGRMMQALPQGAMLSVPLSEAELAPYLGGQLSLAVMNAPRMSVISGTVEDVDRLQADLTARGIACRRLHTSHAFHSAMMEPIIQSFTELVRGVRLHPPEMPYLSNLRGGWITAEDAANPGYWAAHLRSTVRFSQNLETVLNGEATILLEVGPNQSLSSLARQQGRKPAELMIIASMRHPQEPQADTAVLAAALGRLWVAGASPDWGGYYGEDKPYRIPLPAYPFERKRYWIEPKVPAQVQAEGTPQAAVTSLVKRSDASSWYYQPSWQRTAWPVRDAAARHRWLIISDAVGLAEKARDHLLAGGNQVVRVLPGDLFAHLGENEFVLNLEEKSHYDRLLNAMGENGKDPLRILYLATLTGEQPDTLENLAKSQSAGFYGLLALAQALGEKGFTAPVELVVITNHQHEVTGGEKLDAAQACVAGPCIVIPQEYPNIRCHNVDIEWTGESGDAHSHKDDHMVARILNEFGLGRGEREVAFRGAYRWAKTYIANPLHPDPQAGPVLRDGGVYVITGGLGGIGLALAQHISKGRQVKIALINRSAFLEPGQWSAWLETHPEDDRTSRRIRALEEMVESGAEILILQADVSEREQMEAAIARIKKELGEINGVIHAAGLPGGGIIQLKSRQQAAEVLEAKVAGTWILGQLIDTEQVDFVILCSSIDAVTGGPGRSDYTSANAFQDAFAAMKNAGRQMPKYLAVNWGPWQEVGMKVDADMPASLQAMKLESLRNGLLTSEAADAFEKILAARSPQTVVSPIDFNTLLDLARPVGAQSRRDETQPVPESIQAEKASNQESASARPEMRSNYAAAASEVEKRLVDIWQNLIGIEPIGVHDNFFELGGHSLMATQILSRLQDAYRISLPLRTFFEASTISELSKRVEALLWVEQNKEAPAASAADREELTL